MDSIEQLQLIFSSLFRSPFVHIILIFLSVSLFFNFFRHILHFCDFEFGIHDIFSHDENIIDYSDDCSKCPNFDKCCEYNCRHTSKYTVCLREKFNYWKNKNDLGDSDEPN